MIDKVKEVLSKQLRISVDKIDNDAGIMEDLGADSLDLVEMLMNVESEWDIVVEDGEVGDLKVIGDVVDLVYRKIN